MIAADTSTWIAFLQGEGGEDAELLDKALEDRQVLMVPAVLTELLSDPKLPPSVAATLSEIPLDRNHQRLLGTGRRIASPRFWRSASKRVLGDALIAQCCIDRGIPLLTRDRDFRAFSKAPAWTL